MMASGGRAADEGGEKRAKASPGQDRSDEEQRYNLEERACS